MDEQVVYWVMDISVPDWEAIQPHVPEHMDYLRICQQRGQLYAAGSFEDQTGGLVIFIAPDRSAAEELARADPYVRENVAHYTLHLWEKLF
jgi:hypothetical protein